MAYNTLLSIIARINPQIWDYIYPHGPVIGYSASPTIGIAPVIDRVALNPQPLPPGDRFLVGAAELAHDIVRTAVGMEARGESALTFVTDTIDDWCGTPWPHKFPFPWPGPRRDPELDPHAFDVQAGRIIAAIIFTSVAERVGDEKFSAVFADGAEKLTNAAINSRGTRTVQPARATTTKKRR